MRLYHASEIGQQAANGTAAPRAFSAKVGTGVAFENASKQQLRAGSLIQISLNTT